eukprot:1050224-Rhodomonas_salina.1
MLHCCTPLTNVVTLSQARAAPPSTTPTVSSSMFAEQSAASLTRAASAPLVKKSVPLMRSVKAAFEDNDDGEKPDTDGARMSMERPENSTQAPPPTEREHSTAVVVPDGIANEKCAERDKDAFMAGTTALPPT